MSHKILALKGHGSRTPFAASSGSSVVATNISSPRRWHGFRQLTAAGGMILLLAATGCGRGGNGTGDGSTLQYAHWQAQTTYGGPMGRLLAMQQGFSANYDKVRVCVELGHPTLADADVMFETKLAYAAWLKASGRFSEMDWARLEFVGQASCLSSAAWGAIVSFGNPQRVTAPSDIVGNFREARINCQRQGCNMPSLTLGLGAPGAVSASYRHGDARRWQQIHSLRPSFSYMSYRVDWSSLESDLRAKPMTVLATSTRDALLATLRALRADPRVSLTKLSAFMASLKQVRAVANREPVFAQLCNDYFRNGSGSLNQVFRPQFVAFHTLLHEVGHQMGMDHADAPDGNSITGQAPGATRTSAGQWVNGQSTMAYGDQYLYMTDDDEAGAMSNARTINDWLASHR